LLKTKHRLVASLGAEARLTAFQKTASAFLTCPFPSPRWITTVFRFSSECLNLLSFLPFY